MERMQLSIKWLSRLEVLTKIKEGHFKQSKEAEILGIRPRQIRRLVQRLKLKGPKGVISRKVGALSNNQLRQEKKKLILAFFKQKDHFDFGPTLAQEYLTEEGNCRNPLHHTLWPLPGLSFSCNFLASELH
jgi:hypothetical protein